MTRMFCTLKEAAQTLEASEDQIQALLERGLLQEFREGPHRLLREADIGALALRRERPSKARRAARKSSRVGRPSAPPSARAKAGRSAERRRRVPSGVVTQPPRASRREEQGPKTQDLRLPAPDRPVRPSLVRLPAPVPPSRSLRQWFWMGLLQDRPIIIALLAGLALLFLAAVVAGLCFAAETF